MKRLNEPIKENKEDKSHLSIVRINPGGGPVIMTTLNTLTLTFPDSVIARMFSHREAIPLDDEGNYFIDTDPVLFAAIINILRRPCLLMVVPQHIDAETWWDILDYWQLKTYEINVEEKETFSQTNEEIAMNIYRFEYQVAQCILKSRMQKRDTSKTTTTTGMTIWFAYNYLYTKFETPVQIVEKISSKIDVTGLFDLHIYIEERLDRFKQFFQYLLPSHKVYLTFESCTSSEKPRICLKISHILTPDHIEKVANISKK